MTLWFQRAPEENGRAALSLQEIVLVGNSEKQVKFSELTLDMFRMLQAFEREPEEYQAYTLENSADFTGNQVTMVDSCYITKQRNPLTSWLFPSLIILYLCYCKDEKRDDAIKTTESSQIFAV